MYTVKLVVYKQDNLTTSCFQVNKHLFILSTFVLVFLNTYATTFDFSFSRIDYFLCSMYNRCVLLTDDSSVKRKRMSSGTSALDTKLMWVKSSNNCLYCLHSYFSIILYSYPLVLRHFDTMLKNIKKQKCIKLQTNFSVTETGQVFG